MNFGIVSLAAITCKAEASHRSEQINQLLFGDIYKVLEVETDWVKISSDYDGYEGWIHKKHHTPISEADYLNRKSGSQIMTLEPVGKLREQSGKNIFYLPPGSTLHFFTKGNFQFSGKVYTYRGKIASQDRSDLIKYAKYYLNAPYLWGGKTPFGIDCSGFIQMTFKLCGIKLPRDSAQQAEAGFNLKKFSDTKKGDLVFFGEGDKINHVGMIFKKNLVIHASGKVRIDKMDDTGILNGEGNGYTHLLKRIRRV